MLNTRVIYDSIYQHIEAINELPLLSSFNVGIGGDRGLITIIGRGYVLHAYFREDIINRPSISIALHGPLKDTEHLKTDLYAVTIGDGLVTIDVLKEILRLLDAGESPVEYVQNNIIPWPDETFE